MDGFDLEKYQGKWYEQKFHDWTQFKASASITSLI
jgi:lipocalin